MTLFFTHGSIALLFYAMSWSKELSRFFKELDLYGKMSLQTTFSYQNKLACCFLIFSGNFFRSLFLNSISPILIDLSKSILPKSSSLILSLIYLSYSSISSFLWSLLNFLKLSTTSSHASWVFLISCEFFYRVKSGMSSNSI